MAHMEYGVHGDLIIIHPKPYAARLWLQGLVGLGLRV